MLSIVRINPHQNKVYLKGIHQNFPDIYRVLIHISTFVPFHMSRSTIVQSTNHRLKKRLFVCLLLACHEVKKQRENSRLIKTKAASGSTSARDLCAVGRRIRRRVETGEIRTDDDVHPATNLRRSGVVHRCKQFTR